MRVLSTYFMLLTLVWLATGNIGQADWDAGDDYKMHAPQLPNPKGWDVCLNHGMIADDFECAESGLITDIHFWVSWRKDLEGFKLITWQVAIYSDNKGKPGQRLWRWSEGDGTLTWRDYGDGNQGWLCPYEELMVSGDHKKFYQVNIAGIEDGFEQKEGTLYWLVIYAKGDGEVLPGWKTSTSSYFNLAKWYHPKLGWTDIDEPVTDLAFVITNDGEEPTLMDYGDAPDGSYPTYLSNDGARHQYVRGVYLGTKIVDLEADGQPNSTATGDDTDTGGDDEDGVQFTTDLIQGQSAEVEIVASIKGYLSAWMDFNGDGDWLDSGEQIASSMSLASGTNSLSFSVPSSAQVGTSFVRFRFSLEKVPYPTGEAASGEVEDYRIQIKAPEYEWDFGDAPEMDDGSGYPTRLSSNGARHVITENGPWLGPDDDAPDAETDGQPEASALGDNHLGKNDEDGVRIPILQPGRSQTLVMRVNGGGGVVKGWIDFNGNHQWDSSEQVVNGDFANGIHNVTVNVPSSAKIGETFARFRIADKVAGATGAADSGEVEDYLVQVREAIPLDSFEPDDSRDQAMNLGILGQTRRGLSIDHSGDEDWYKWNADSGGTLKVRLEFSHDLGDLQLEIYDSNGVRVGRSTGDDDDEEVEVAVLPDQDYFIRVFGADFAINPDYSVDLFTSDSDNYAVLFAGGSRIAKNFPRYYNNTKNLYNTLVNSYDVDPDNIYVLYADGTDPDVDLTDSGTQVNSDMSYATHVLEATPENLEDVLTNILTPVIDGNDHFFFWSFDHGGGTYGSSGTTGEETLTGWHSSIDDEDLADWLDDINPGRFTFVAAQCFSGGMLDNLMPMSFNEHGCAATNHYEYSWGDGFAAAYRSGLLNHSTSHNVYEYAYNHDPYATDGEGSGGDADDYIEHPWEANSHNFAIFADNSNNLPWFDDLLVVRFVPPWEEVIIPYEVLQGATWSGDPDLREVGFRIEGVQEGSLSLNGTPVVPGETVVGPGDELVYQPSATNNSNPFNAFSVRAFDGATISDQVLSIPLQLTEEGTLQAMDDVAEVNEDVVDAIIDVLANDLGTDPLSVVSVGTSTHGTVQIIGGQVLYTPAADYSGSDSFIYFMTDDPNGDDTDWARVSVRIRAINDPPEAYADEFDIPVNAVDYVIDVLDNDFDAESKPLTYFPDQSGPYPLVAVIEGNPEHGVLQALPDGTFEYTPTTDYEGEDALTYRADDGESLSELVMATLHIGSRISPKWFQPPDVSTHGIDIQVDQQDGYQRVLADDFLCTACSTLTEVRLWGSWLNDDIGEIEKIRLSVYSDDPVGEEGSDAKNLYSTPDVLLWQRNFTPDEFKTRLYTSVRKGEYWWDILDEKPIPYADTQIWQVRIKIPEDDTFRQTGTKENPQVYWLALEAETAKGQFGWKTRRRPGHYNDDAVFGLSKEDATNWQELCYPSTHPYNGLGFEDLAVGTLYTVGNSLTTSGTPVFVQAFQWSNGIWTGRGSAHILGAGMAGGSGHEINVNNCTLFFDFPLPPDRLDLLYGEYGGNLNIKINGDFRNFEDFTDIHGIRIGGVDVEVTKIGTDQGSLSLIGTINTLAIGGQELYLDEFQWPHSIDLAFALYMEECAD